MEYVLISAKIRVRTAVNILHKSEYNGSKCTYLQWEHRLLNYSSSHPLMLNVVIKCQTEGPSPILDVVPGRVHSLNKSTSLNRAKYMPQIPQVHGLGAELITVLASNYLLGH